MRGQSDHFAPALPLDRVRLLWRREMLLGSYFPRWVQATGPEGKFRALAFVVHTGRSGYAGKLGETEQLTIQIAAGEYVNHVAGGIPMNQGEFLRLSELGLTRSEMQRLFRPFAQASEQVARRFGGAGLGLVLAKRLAKAMGSSRRTGKQSTSPRTVVAARKSIVFPPTAATPSTRPRRLVSCPTGWSTRAPSTKAKMRYSKTPSLWTARR